MKHYVSFPLGYEIKDNTYLRTYSTYNLEFKPIHPEWHPPEIINKKALKTENCCNCETLLICSKPWTYFKCRNRACGAMYHRHCINLHTRTALEDGLLDISKWVCCGYYCLSAYPLEQSWRLLLTMQERECRIFVPTLTRSQSFTQDMLCPHVIEASKLCKLRDAYSVYWDHDSYHVHESVHRTLTTKPRHITAIHDAFTR